MAFELPALPYAADALAPHMSAETLEFHHGKHHKAYVDKTNTLVADTDLASARLSDVIRAAKERGLFRREYLATLLADPKAHITPLQGSELWQAALLELWLQTQEV